MINNIGLYQNIKIPQNVAFKASQGNLPVTSPIENATLNGANALASYNSAMINKPEKFDIPLLKPLQMPKAVDSIDGERIYNSAGKLQCVVKEVGDKKYVYSNETYDYPEINNIKIYDKKTGNKIFEQSEFLYENETNNEAENICWINEYSPITGSEMAASEYKNGKPVYKDTSTHHPDGTTEYKAYDFDKQEYCHSYFKPYDSQESLSLEKIYDAKGNLIREYYSGIRSDRTFDGEIKYENGKVVSRETSESQAEQIPEAQRYINNPELKPAECPEFMTSIENIEGEKTYYSNGMLESVKTPDGKIYEISLDGNRITLHDKNKSIEFNNIKEIRNKFCIIREDFGDVSKRTSYCGENCDEISSISYGKGNIEKRITFVNGKPSDYSESKLNNDTWEDTIHIEYAPNGGVLNVYRNSDV